MHPALPRHPLRRRRFIATILASAAAPAFLRAASPNEKLNIAVIACGGRGAANLKSVSTENIVALYALQADAWSLEIGWMMNGLVDS